MYLPPPRLQVMAADGLPYRPALPPQQPPPARAAGGKAAGRAGGAGSRVAGVAAGTVRLSWILIAPPPLRLGGAEDLAAVVGPDVPNVPAVPADEPSAGAETAVGSPQSMTPLPRWGGIRQRLPALRCF